MVSAPVKSAPVNDPKNEGTPGAQVRMMAPKKSGTIIMPPGMRSIDRLMGICTMAGLAGAGTAPTFSRDMLLLGVQLYKSARVRAARPPPGEAHVQEQAVDVRDRLRDLRHRRRGRVLEPGAGPPRREGHAGERHLSRAAGLPRGADGALAAGLAPEPDPSRHRERRPRRRGPQAGGAGREAHRIREALVGDGSAHRPPLLRGEPAARADRRRGKRVARRGLTPEKRLRKFRLVQLAV